MSDKVPTIKIKSDKGRVPYRIINKADFNKEIHEEYKEKGSKSEDAGAGAGGDQFNRAKAAKFLKEKGVTFKNNISNDDLKALFDEHSKAA
jgi:hypothetical protein